MSYTEIEIGGKKRGLKFNQMAIILTYKNVAEGLEDVTSVPAIVFAGLTANCYVKRVEPDFTFEDVVDWCESLPTEEINKAVAALTESESYKKLLPKEDIVKEKKSRTSMKQSA